jgi:hypothetical protein
MLQPLALALTISLGLTPRPLALELVSVELASLELVSVELVSV